ncbi:MAG: hypothetical protein C0469_11165 [Cyanobacteria bacterium DS2.3.42]|nr:hypothetical protein [Cyanobacteria bacterium DS2.3.42]
MDQALTTARTAILTMNTSLFIPARSCFKSMAKMLVTAGDALDLPAETVHAAENKSQKSVAYFICTK